MGLSGRKEKIIEAVVDSYINRCEPISSADIQKNFLPLVSSATIRNELASLEDLGYLTQPHTSSGRIPTAEAYRLYVEKLMPRRKLTRSELKIVKRYFNRKITDLDDILKSTAKVISEITNLTSVAYVQNFETAIIENIKIVKISDNTALFIIVTDRGILKDVGANIAPSISDEYFDKAAKFVTSVFAGWSINEAAHNKKLIQRTIKEYENVFKTVIKILKNNTHEEIVSDIVLEGSAKILEQPEYANLKKAKAMLELLDAKEELIPVLQNNDDMSLNILISKDNEIKDGMPECAIVTANYEVKGVSIGKAGVIGPIRMDYPKVISVLDYIGKTINLLPESKPQTDETEKPRDDENFASREDEEEKEPEPIESTHEVISSDVVAGESVENQESEAKIDAEFEETLEYKEDPETFSKILADSLKNSIDKKKSAPKKGSNTKKKK
ncbi:MAG: heat-inducible transcriptional repressor HrcA [Firmicutes bacterium]|nr:heat-inducible transcriptional repressor HrcA [Bacillota bacterium]